MDRDLSYGNAEGHLSDDELQERLEEAPEADDAFGRHLEKCLSCRERHLRFRELFTLLDGAAPPDAPASVERAVFERLFPAGEPSAGRLPSRMPAWVPAAAVLLLSLATTLSLSILRVLGAVVGPVVEVALQGRVDYFIAPLRLAADALSRLSIVSTWLGRLWDASPVVFTALLHLWEAPEIRFMILASAGVYSLIALGWGSRLLLNRSRGGSHNVLFV